MSRLSYLDVTIATVTTTIMASMTDTITIIITTIIIINILAIIISCQPKSQASVQNCFLD